MSGYTNISARISVGGEAGVDSVRGEGYTGEWRRRLRARLPSGLFVDLNRDTSNTIFLAGSGRSGTTWVSDIINYRREYRYIFEPFHPEKVSACRIFGMKRYIQPGGGSGEQLRTARRVLSGALRSRWSDRFHTRVLIRQRLVKDIRANLMLGWLKSQFPEMPLVLLLRHPCAVAYSQMKLGWRPDLDAFFYQKELMEDHLEPFRDALKGAGSDFERHVMAWCIENYVPLRQLRRGEAHVAFYEDFCERPEEEVKGLFSFLGKKVDGSVFEKMKRPSLLSREGSAVVSGEQLVGGWRSHLTEEQIRRASEILDLFGLSGVYSAGDPKPDPDGLRLLMRS